MTQKGLTIDFYRSTEARGGTQNSFRGLAQEFGLREVSYFVAANARLLQFRPEQYRFFELQGGAIIDEYQDLYEKLFGPEIVIKNSIVPTFHKTKCPQIAVLNDNNIDGPEILYKSGYWDYMAYSQYRIGFTELQKTTLMASKKVVAVSQHTAYTYLRHFPFLKDKIVVIPNGVDTDVFKPAKDKSELRKKYNIPEDAKVALFVGDFIPLKGTHIVTELCRRHPELTWILCFKFVRPETSKPPKLKNVRIVTNVPHEKMPEIYQLADVYVQPSAAESCGLSALEAIACGVPIVVSNTGIFSGDTGFRGFGHVVTGWTADEFHTALKYGVLTQGDKQIHDPVKELQALKATKKDWIDAWRKLLASGERQS